MSAVRLVVTLATCGILAFVLSLLALAILAPILGGVW